MMTPTSTDAFVITKVAPSQKSAFIDVHVEWPGGTAVLSFGEHLPDSYVLNQVRLEVRRLRAEAVALERFKGLLGRHDL